MTQFGTTGTKRVKTGYVTENDEMGIMNRLINNHNKHTIQDTG